MKRFIKELRRREVFRTAGLYVGICWIVIEVGSVILPVFDAPEWIFRGAIVAAVAGFPVMLVLAWFFDVNEQGISLQADPTDTTVVHLGARKSDFAIIGVLVLALLISLTLNLRGPAPVVAAPEPVTVLVMRFENTTGDPVFDHVVEQALMTGLERAPHVVAFGAGDTPPGDAQRGIVTARPVNGASPRVLRREQARRILSGSVASSGAGYRITVDAVDVPDNRSVFSVSENAGSRDAVLAAIGKLSARIRKELGGKVAGDEQGRHASTFVAVSLAAASAYAAAMQAELDGDLVEAARRYEQAVTADANLGRAFARLALIDGTLGQREAANARWARASTLSDTMTEREWLHALGRYESSVAQDSDAALSVFAALVDKYPADVDARERYAIEASDQLDFATALEQTRAVLSILPGDTRALTRLADYQMYAGDWDAASEAATQAIAADAEQVGAYLPMAMASMARGDMAGARETYRQMAARSTTAASAATATLGLADVDLYVGNVSAARDRLRGGIDAAVAQELQRLAALQHIALAQSHAEQNDFPAAISAVTAALGLDDHPATVVPAALIYLQAGEQAPARAIADALTAQQSARSRAFGQMLNGMLLARADNATASVLAMRDALATADLWLIRFEIGKAYLRAGNFPAALGEMTTLKQRAGEATSVFLDGMPTYRFMAEVPYWTGRVEEALNMPAAARSSYRQYLVLRPEGGALAEDAAARLE